MANNSLGKLAALELYFSKMFTKASLVYLTDQRHFTEDIIEQFHLGYFDGNISALLKFVDLSFLEQIGFVFKGYSPFSKRIIFPVHNAHNEIIAFFGRTMQLDVKPKFTSTRHKKGNHLFGLHLAKNDIRRTNMAIVVEGHPCVITAHQNYMNNVVATGGTALTKTQIRLLSRYTDNIILLMDNDVAGIQAMSKILAKHKSPFVNLHRVMLPSSTKDLDEFLQKYTKKQAIILLRTQLEKKKTTQYKIKQKMKRSHHAHH